MGSGAIRVTTSICVGKKGMLRLALKRERRDYKEGLTDFLKRVFNCSAAGRETLENKPEAYA